MSKTEKKQMVDVYQVKKQMIGGLYKKKKRNKKEIYFFFYFFFNRFIFLLFRICNKDLNLVVLYFVSLFSLFSFFSFPLSSSRLSFPLSLISLPAMVLLKTIFNEIIITLLAMKSLNRRIIFRYNEDFKNWLRSQNVTDVSNLI